MNFGRLYSPKNSVSYNPRSLVQDIEEEKRHQKVKFTVKIKNFDTSRSQGHGSKDVYRSSGIFRPRPTPDSFFTHVLHLFFLFSYYFGLSGSPVCDLDVFICISRSPIDARIFLRPPGPFFSVIILN